MSVEESICEPEKAIPLPENRGKLIFSRVLTQGKISIFLS
jgi:hypothetical protein